MFNCKKFNVTVIRSICKKSKHHIGYYANFAYMCKFYWDTELDFENKGLWNNKKDYFV